MKKPFLIISLILFFFFFSGISAEAIDKSYTIKTIYPDGFRYYKIEKGDTLWEIAEFFLNDPQEWTKITYDNGESIKNPLNLTVGKIVKIPPTTICTNTKFSALHSGYWKQDDYVCFANKKVSLAQPHTFITFSDNYQIAKDHKNVFYRNYVVKDADALSFEVLSFFYAKDKNFVYQIDGYDFDENAETIPIISHDAENFQLLDNLYAKDKKNIYGAGLKIQEADMSTFEILDYGYAKDKNYIYTEGEILAVDKQSFTFLNNGYVKDKYHVYYGTINVEADVNTFQVLKKSYAKDKYHVFFAGQINVDADPNTFELINDQYSKDAKNIFSYLEKIPDVDMYSFEILENGYAKDKDHVYCGISMLENADPANFQILNEAYTKDTQNVYWYNGKIQKADADSFKALSKVYAKDKNHVYQNGRIILVDPEDFIYEEKNENDVIYSK